MKLHFKFRVDWSLYARVTDKVGIYMDRSRTIHKTAQINEDRSISQNPQGQFGSNFQGINMLNGGAIEMIAGQNSQVQKVTNRHTYRLMICVSHQAIQIQQRLIHIS